MGITGTMQSDGARYGGDERVVRMVITGTTRAIVKEALGAKRMSHKEFAAKLDVNPGWVTKFFNGKLQSLSEKRIGQIEEALGVKFQRLVEKGGIPGPAIELGRAMNRHPELAEIVSGLLKLVRRREDEEDAQAGEG